MLIRINIYILLLLLITIFLNGQAVYTNYSDVKKPKLITHLKINYIVDDVSDFLDNSDKFISLTHIKVCNIDNSYLPQSFYELKAQEIIIENSPDLNFKSFFNSLTANDNLRSLILDNNELKTVPYEISKLDKLEAIEIKNNEGIKLGNTINVIKNLKSLKKLGLSVNMISDLPNNITELDHLEYLDIRSNNLNDLPNGMQKLRNLDSLRMEENLILYPVNSIKNLKGINLRYLSIDGELSERDKQALKKIFPELDIDIKKPQLLLNNSDTLVNNLQKPIFIDTNRTFGTLKVSESGFKAYSTAYLSYPVLFYSERFKYNFDTLLFEERYLDTNYAGTVKINVISRYFSIKLRSRSSLFSDKIYFDFKAGHRYIAGKKGAMLSELNAFNNYIWVVKDDYKKKEFKKKYCKWNKWVDIRLFFNEANKDFIVEMKHLSGFDRFTAYPMLVNERTDIKKSQSKYVSVNSRYISALETKKKKFHNKLYRDKKSYDRALQKQYKNTWKAFRKVYFSEEEKKMTNKEWLEYYDELISKEKKALYSSVATVDNFKRSLELEKYYSSITSYLNNNNAFNVEVNFSDEKKRIIPVKELIVINIDNRSYYSLLGNLGIDFQTLYIDNTSMVIFAELRNGNIGYITRPNMEKINFTSENQYTIPLKIIEKKMSSVGQFFDLFGL